jgi:hypothetical protein
VKLATAAVLLGALALAPSAAAEDVSLTVRGFGTAVVDGNLAPGEWDGAGRYDFQAARAPIDGGGTVPASFYVMNDATNLYVALRVSVQDIGWSSLDTVFHAPGTGGFGEGSDILRTSATAFEDLHFHPISSFEWTRLPDVADGGTSDGRSATQTHLGYVVYEVVHPLNTADDRHDFSLTIPKHIVFYAAFWYCLDSCAATFIPGSSLAELVVVSGTHVPPQTTITSGPANGAQIREERVFEFTGTDDVAPADEIGFECQIDGEAWSSCESPFGGVVDDGWHTLAVRALDEMLNVDPSPARRRWRIDTHVPSRPKVTVRGRAARFSAGDRGTPARRLRFRCGIDTKRLHACGSLLRVPGRGRHVLRVRAVDPAGNESPTATVRLR